MKIIDITPDTENLYFCCLEEWSDEMKEAGDHKRNWYNHMKGKGVKVKFAQDDNNTIGGMIQYIPLEHSMFEGENLYVVLCIWVHGHKQGIGNYQKKGMGKALLKAAEDDCRSMGSNGLVTWGIIMPAFMRASWFKRHGYKVVDRNGMMRLLWKPFNNEALRPKFIKRKQKPLKGKNKVNISIFKNGWCPVANLANERALRASKEFPEKVEIHEYNTLDREVVNEWGIAGGLFIDGKEIRTGPPPSFEKIRKKIMKRAHKISQ